MEKLPSRHFVGIEFFRFPDLKSLDYNDYFKCLDVIRPLLKDPDFQDVTPGFYINYITNLEDDKLSSLRITYYTINPHKTQDTIRKFANQNMDKIAVFDSKSSRRPDKNEPVQEVEGEELRFRNFLNTNTQIFLEVVQEYGIEPLRKLIYKYRYCFLPHRAPPEIVFEEVFGRSEYFRRLHSVSLDKQYWEDLVNRFNASDFGLHFLVNMSCVEERWGYEPFFREDWIVREKE